MSDSETRKASVVAAAQALREDRLAGAMALLAANGYGLMFSALSAVEVDTCEAQIVDLRPGPMNGTEVGRGSGRHVGGALLKALGPMLEKAGRPKLKGIQGGRAIDKHRTLVEDGITPEPENAGKHVTPDDLVFDGHNGMVDPGEVT